MHLQNRHFIKLDKHRAHNAGPNVRYNVLRWVYGSHVPVEYPFSFLEYLLWLQGQEIATLDPHHTPQWTPLYDIPGVTHFRLEEFAETASRLERKFGMESSHHEKGLFSSGHHLRKGQIPEAAILELLDHGIPLSTSENFIVPEVDRQVLQDTAFGRIIEGIFRKDIEIYDAIG
jgi:hypothetical protein